MADNNHWPPDWQRICLDIRRHISMARAARIIGCDQAHLARLARGEVNQPRFLTGVKILDLHYDVNHHAKT